MKRLGTFNVILFAGVFVAINGQATELNSELVESWFAPTNFYSAIQVEVSRNNFLPDNHPAFSKEPGKMVQIEGVILPQSFYIKYDAKAYGAVFVQGESDQDYWSLGDRGVGKTSKDSLKGGSPTNSLTIGILRQKSYLRGYTEMGLIHMEPGTLKIDGTNFTATSPDGRTITGRFAAISDLGLPMSFAYQVSGPEHFHVDGSFADINPTNRTYDCVLALWRGDDLWKKIRIKCEKLQIASDSDLTRIFTPEIAEFQIPQVTNPVVNIESNGRVYEPLPSGQMREVKVKLYDVENPNRLKWIRGFFMTFLILSAVVPVALITYKKIQTRKSKGEKQ